MADGFRAQVLGVGGWVDGGLFVHRKHAEADAERLAARYGGNETRVVEVTDSRPQLCDREHWKGVECPTKECSWNI